MSLSPLNSADEMLEERLNVLSGDTSMACEVVDSYLSLATGLKEDKDARVSRAIYRRSKDVVASLLRHIPNRDRSLATAALRCCAFMLYHPGIMENFSLEQKQQLLDCLLGNCRQAKEQGGGFDKGALAMTLWNLSVQRFPAALLRDRLSDIVEALEGALGARTDSESIEVNVIQALHRILSQVSEEHADRVSGLLSADQLAAVASLAYYRLLCPSEKVHPIALKFVEEFECAFRTVRSRVSQTLLMDVEKVIAPKLEYLFHQGKQLHVMKTWNILVGVMSTDLLANATLPRRALNKMLEVARLGLTHTDLAVQEMSFEAWHTLVEHYAMIPSTLATDKILALLYKPFAKTCVPAFRPFLLRSTYRFFVTLGPLLVEGDNFIKIGKGFLEACVGSAGPAIDMAETRIFCLEALAQIVHTGNTPSLSTLAPFTPALRSRDGAWLLVTLPYVLNALKVGLLHVDLCMDDTFADLGRDIFRSMATRCHDLAQHHEQNAGRILQSLLQFVQDLSARNAGPQRVFTCVQDLFFDSDMMLWNGVKAKAAPAADFPVVVLARVLLQGSQVALLESAGTAHAVVSLFSRMVSCALKGQTGLACTKELTRVVDSLASQQQWLNLTPPSASPDSRTSADAADAANSGAGLRYEAVVTVWGVLAVALAAFIDRTNEVYSGDVDSEDFSAVHMAITLPFAHFFGTPGHEKVKQEMVEHWVQLYTAFARACSLKSLVRNRWTEDISARFKKSVDFSRLSDNNHELLCRCVAAIASHTVLKGASSSPAKKKESGNLKSLPAVINLLFENNCADRAAAQAASILLLLSTLYDLFRKAAAFEVHMALVVNLLPTLVLMARHCCVLPSRNRTSQEAIKVWSAVCESFSRNVSQEITGSLNTLAPLFEETLVHKKPAVASRALDLWNSTFGTATWLVYPDSLQTVVDTLRRQQVDIKTPGLMTPVEPAAPPSPPSAHSTGDSQASQASQGLTQDAELNAALTTPVAATTRRSFMKRAATTPQGSAAGAAATAAAAAAAAAASAATKSQKTAGSAGARSRTRDPYDFDNNDEDVRPNTSPRKQRTASPKKTTALTEAQLERQRERRAQGLGFTTYTDLDSVPQESQQLLSLAPAALSSPQSLEDAAEKRGPASSVLEAAADGKRPGDAADASAAKRAPGAEGMVDAADDRPEQNEGKTPVRPARPAAATRRSKRKTRAGSAAKAPDAEADSESAEADSVESESMAATTTTTATATSTTPSATTAAGPDDGGQDAENKNQEEDEEGEERGQQQSSGGCKRRAVDGETADDPVVPAGDGRGAQPPDQQQQHQHHHQHQQQQQEDEDEDNHPQDSAAGQADEAVEPDMVAETPPRRRATPQASWVSTRTAANDGDEQQQVLLLDKAGEEEKEVAEDAQPPQPAPKLEEADAQAESDEEEVHGQSVPENEDYAGSPMEMSPCLIVAESNDDDSPQQSPPRSTAVRISSLQKVPQSPPAIHTRSHSGRRQQSSPPSLPKARVEDTDASAAPPPSPALVSILRTRGERRGRRHISFNLYANESFVFSSSDATDILQDSFRGTGEAPVQPFSPPLGKVLSPTTRGTHGDRASSASSAPVAPSPLGSGGNGSGGNNRGLSKLRLSQTRGTERSPRVKRCLEPAMTSPPADKEHSTSRENVVCEALVGNRQPIAGFLSSLARPRGMKQLLSSREIHTVGDLSALRVDQATSMLGLKIDDIRRALTVYEQKELASRGSESEDRSRECKPLADDMGGIPVVQDDTERSMSVLELLLLARERKDELAVLHNDQLLQAQSVIADLLQCCTQCMIKRP
eukprot:m.215952 g.215952  ORF g.215952 m.215952 type:complete len:1805 (+) comp22209_c0_seq2:258-5672(+)